MISPTMRTLWFDHVAKTRKRNSKGNNTCTHREAMKQASITWPAIKLKLEKKRLREAKKKARELKKGNES